MIDNNQICKYDSTLESMAPNSDVTLFSEDEDVLVILLSVATRLLSEGMSPEEAVDALVDHGCEDHLASELVEIASERRLVANHFLRNMLKAAALFFGATIAVCGGSWIASLFLGALSASAGNNEFLLVCVGFLQKCVGIGIGAGMAAWNNDMGSRPFFWGTIFGIASYYLTLYRKRQAERLLTFP